MERKIFVRQAYFLGCFSNIWSVKHFQQTIKNFQPTSKIYKNARPTKFLTLRVNRALSV